MLKSKSIAIISSNTLLGIGLREILNNYFLPRSVDLFQTFGDFHCSDQCTSFDLIFTHPQIFVSHIDDLQSIKNKLIVFSENGQQNISSSSLATLNISVPENEIATELEKIIPGRIKNNASENTEELSLREIEVLKLVALGRLNKQIADQLNISMHTVVSHRKNITRKLGIKTVSGLTVYSLMNGIVNSGDLE